MITKAVYDILIWHVWVYLFISFHYRELEGRSYVFLDRGQIELRGFGYLQTYYLIGSETLSDDDLIGRAKSITNDVTYINEGTVNAPFGKGNKVHPVEENPSSGGNTINQIPLLYLRAHVVLSISYI